MRLRQLHHLSLGILFFFTTVIGLAQPVAEFDVFNNGSRTICAPNSLVATFEDLSTNTGPNPTYQWITPVGNSTLSMPTFVFSDPGCYDITLIIGNSFGNDTITKTCFIEVYPQPEPAFTASDTVGCVPLDVTFTDASIANSPGGNTDWLWILSNTFQSTQQNPSFTFTDVGDTISVFLEVTNSFGCIATEFFPNVVTPLEAPIADFVADTNAACEAPFQVNFSNLSVENGASNFGTIIYTWIFPGGVIAGGGSTFTGPTPPPVTYGADGQYDVTLILTGLQGCADTIVRPSYIGIGGVDADFNADQTTVCLGEEIIFTSTSSGGVTLTEWDFGETPGIDATGGIVTHTYSAPGTYDVTVFANNSECGDTLTRTAYITVLDVPVASFTQDRDIDCQPGNPFTFTDQSTGATSWSWDFGDNNTSNQQNPTHTYTGFGTFIVTLTATNSVGCTSTTTSTIEIAPPQINFSITPSEGCAPLDVAFADLTVSPVDSIISWEWNFGTGTAVPPTATIQNPTTQYTVPGSYDVTLIVITANGCTDTLRRSGAVRVGTPPISTFTFDPDTICVNDVVTFQADSVNSDWEYLWDFQYVDPGAHVLDLPNPTPTYPDTGLYSVSLVVSNNGCQDTTTIDDAVFVSPPEAGFEIDQTLICSLPATITFTDTSVGPADIYDWSVNGNVFASFGGQQAPGPFQIDTPGVYLFQQRIENSLTGCRDSAIVVVAAGNPQASFTYAPTRGCYPLEVTVNNTSQNFTSGLFSFINEQGGQSNFSFSDNIIIQDTGLYDIRLVVSDQFGCRDTSFVPDGLEVVGPFAQYEAVRNPACPGETITFTETSTTYETTIVNWSWDFGDGGASGSGQVDSNVYTAPGLYNAVLTVTDDEGCTDDITLPISITSPTADFVVADTSTCAGNPIPFNNNSNGIGNSYLWLFGDGDTSTATAPLHPYFPDDSLTGTFYDVTLIATDINGCSDTVTRDDYIFIEPFDAFFFSNDTLGVCPPHPVQLFDQSVGNIVLWDWNFDFGNPQSPIIAGVDSPSVGFVYQAPGLYSVFMVATHEDGCRDTALREDYIFVAGPNGTYDVFPDAICEGEEICISTEILGAVSAIVLYDDGGTAVFDTTTLTGGVDSITSCYTYQAPNTYFPVVVLTDAQGCSFTLRDQDSAQVFARPVAQIVPQDSFGCSPFALNLFDGSILGDTTISIWDWDFSVNNNLVDSSDQQNPIYTFMGDQLYDIELRIEDANGCRDTAITTFTSYEGAIPEFGASDTTGCAPFAVEFSDSSTNAPPILWTWIFGDGDTLEGSQLTSPTHIYQDDGLYTVTLIVTDGLGCSDTVTKVDYINLFRPEANIYADQPVTCNPTTVTFFGDSTVSRRTLERYRWCLFDVALQDTVQCIETFGTEDSAQFTFLDPGSFLVFLTVFDSLGCPNEAEPQTVEIRERITPPAIDMRNVTVDAPDAVTLTWTPYTITDFVEYIIYRLDGATPVEIATLTDQTASSFTDNDPILNTENNIYCYQVAVRNFCDEISNLGTSETHCTIELQTNPLVDAIDLTWSAYQGYDVVQYDIFRTTGYNTATLQQIASVPGNVLSYTDFETFCRDSIEYRVRAIGVDGFVERSLSDVSGNAPIHNKPTESSDIILASVIDDQFTAMVWEQYTGYLPEQYVLQRSLDGVSFTDYTTFPLTEIGFVDTAVNVDAQSYAYRMFVLDQCGDTSALGLIGKTILLNVVLTDNGPSLNWTPYEEWENGVLSYRVEILDDRSGEFVVVEDNLPSTQTNFLDEETSLQQPFYCYRILAEELAGNNTTSVSNEVCVVLPPRIYIPNVFTPNNAGPEANNEFRFFLPNVETANVKIFNRWGELIYETNDYTQYWDGTYNGAPVQEGVYVYLISGEGFNGDEFQRTGTVTVVR